MPTRDTFPCPACGEDVPSGAKVCPACGADETTGWSEQTIYDGTDIPVEAEFDYDKFLEKEGLAKPKRSRKELAWLVVTLLVLAAFFLVYVLSS